MASVDAEAGEADARGGDLGLALAVHAPRPRRARGRRRTPRAGARSRGRRRALAQLGEVDLVLAPGEPGAAPLRALGGGSGPSSSSGSPGAGGTRHAGVAGSSSTARCRRARRAGSRPAAARGDEALSEVADLGHGDVRELAAQLLATEPIVRSLGSARPCPASRSRPCSSQQEGQPVLADLDLVVVLERGGLDAVAVHVRAVQAPEIPDREGLPPAGAPRGAETVTSSRNTSHSGERPISVLPPPAGTTGRPCRLRSERRGPVIPSEARSDSPSSPPSSTSNVIVVSPPGSWSRAMSAPHREQ